MSDMHFLILGMRSGNTSMTLETLGAEYGLTRQRIQQIAKQAGITWESRRRGIFSRLAQHGARG